MRGGRREERTARGANRRYNNTPNSPPSQVLLTTDSTGKFKNSLLRAVSSTPAGSLYTGWLGVQLRQMSWGCVYFTTIGPYKRALRRSLGGPSGEARPGLQNLAAGFLAGSSGALLNTPCDTIRSVVMKQR